MNKQSGRGCPVCGGGKDLPEELVKGKSAQIYQGIALRKVNLSGFPTALRLMRQTHETASALKDGIFRFKNLIHLGFGNTTYVNQELDYGSALALHLSCLRIGTGNTF